MTLLLLAGILILAFSPMQAAHLHKEKEYQEDWCKKAGGVTEYLLDDNTRVDCLTDEYAIEFDFGPKWAEAIGQALYYGIKTGRKPGVVLILEYENDRYEKRLNVVAKAHNITVWIIRPSQLARRNQGLDGDYSPQFMKNLFFNDAADRELSALVCIM